MSEYLAIDSGGYLCMNRQWSVAGCFPEKSRWCSVEEVYLPASKVFTTLSSPGNWILSYITTRLPFSHDDGKRYISVYSQHKAHYTFRASVCDYNVMIVSELVTRFQNYFAKTTYLC